MNISDAAPSAGFFIIPNWFVEGGHLARIKTLSELKVYNALRYFRNRASDAAFPSIDELADNAGVSRGNVSRALSSLAAAGLILLLNPRSGRKGRREWGFPIGCAGATNEEATADATGCAGATQSLRVRNSIVAPAHAIGCAGAITPLFREIEPEEENRQRRARCKAPQPGFDQFWREYPSKKYAKAQCAAKWQTMGLEAMTADVILGLQRFKQSPQWRKDNGQFIPAPLTFLNQRRWEAGETAPNTRPVLAPGQTFIAPD